MNGGDFPAFAVAVGEEGSDPWVHHNGRLVRVDEYACSGHLDRMDADLADVAALGVRVFRYGMPWRLTEPEPGRYDWALWDRALAACERHGLRPVVDLCHFGLPDHHAGFCDGAWVDAFVRYVDTFLSRYREPRWFTPVNEPGITATFSARHGIWNDRRSTLDDYFTALANVTLANLEALARIRGDRDGWWIGAEGFGCELADADDEAGVAVATRDRELQHAVWDLHLGVEPAGAAAALLDVVDAQVLDRISALTGTVPVDRIVAGHDLYPVSVAAHGTRRDRPVTIEDRVAAYEVTATAWYERYRVPLWVAETSNLGLPVDEGPRWLDALVGGIDRLAAAGLPARGICWYSRGDQYDWDTALTEPVGRVTEVGLFDAERDARPVATHVAVLTIAHPDGRAPLAAPIWYEYEPGGDVVMTIGAGSEKAALLEQASVASLCAQSEALPYRFVTVDGPVAVVPADDASRRRIAERYLPAELVDGYLASGSSADMRNVRLTPASWRSNDFSKL